MAEITDISSQLVRTEIVREQQRTDAQRQAERAREDADREDEDAARDAELANSIRRNIDLSADAVFDPDLPRGSIIDIVA